MSFIREVFHTVSNYPGGYRVLYDLIYGHPVSNKHKKKQDNTLRVTLSRLKKKGLIDNQNGKWILSEEGKLFLNEPGYLARNFISNKKPGKTFKKELIVTFDIPERKRKYRDWLRSELVGFGFELVHKSVWFGPALPEEFIEYLDEEGIIRYIRFFRVAEEDLI